MSVQSLKEQLVDLQRRVSLLETQSAIVEGRCAEGKHVVVTMIDTRNMKRHLYFACAACDTLWALAVPSSALVEVEVDKARLTEIRSQL